MNTSAPTHDSTFVIDLRPLGRAAGNHHHIRRSVVSSAPIGLEFVSVPHATPLDIDVELEAVTEGVLVTGTVSAAITGQCVRCLSELNGTVVASLTELFLYPDTETAGAIEEDDEVYVLDSTLELDMEQAVIDGICLALPFAPTCSTIEHHPCPETDTPEPDGVEGEDNDLIDPRWADLERFQHLAMLDEAAQESDSQDS